MGPSHPTRRQPAWPSVRTAQIAAFLLCAHLLTGTLHGQTARWTGVQSLVAGTGLFNPHGVAVDSNRNVYIADVSNNRVLKEVPSSSGYQETVIASTGLNSPSGVAVDASGNVYIADFGDSRILKETLSNGAYTESVVPTVGVSSPLGIAVDASGNLFITDSGNARVIKETWNGSTYSQTSVLGGPTWPDGVAVDSAGNVYVCAPFDGYVMKLAPQGSGYTPAYTFSGMSQAHGVTVDASGNVYIAESGTGRILQETPSGGSYTQTIQLSGLTQPQAIALDASGALYFNDPQNGKMFKLSTSAPNFGSANVGSSVASESLAFVFDTPGTISAPSVVTRGLSGLDFTDAGTGSCTANGTAHAYSAGDTCMVDVSFVPKSPGNRYGATILRDGSGNAIATAYVQGTGIGSELRFPPGTVSALSLPGLSGPLAIAWDEANVYSTQTYTAYDPRNSVVKETWNGSSYTQSTITTNLGYPTALAVDGAGNIYVSDQDNYAVYKFIPTLNGSYTKTTVDNTLGTVAGLAVDGAGDVYIGRGGIGIEKETFSGGTYLRSEIFYGFYGQSIAVDGNGVLYISDGSNLRKETPTANGYSESILATNGIRDVKVDSLGNVYYLTYGASEIEKLTWTGSGYQQSQIGTGQSNLADLATDGSGNILFSTYDSNRAGSIFLRTTINPPSLSFASTPYKSTSSDSPKYVAIENVGNKAALFPVPASGSNPAITSGFVLVPSGGTDCPSVDANSASAGSLDIGQSCEFAISFTPLSTGLITGNLTITSDSVTSLSPANATTSVPLSGTGLQAVPTISWAAPAAISYGTALSAAQLNATASTAGTFSYTPATGTILDIGTHSLSVNFTPTDAADYTTASSSVSITVNPATPSITWAPPAAITYGTPLGSAQLNATSTTAGTFSYSPAAGTVLNAGTQTLKVTFTPSDTTRFTTAQATSTLTVSPAAPSVMMSSSAPSAVVSTAVTLKATVAFSYGTPTGSVTFTDGSSNLGTGTLNAGVATLTTSSLAAGSHSITATYSGDSNFTGTVSAPFSQSIFDFNFGPSKGSSTSATASRGGSATYSLTVTPVSGQSMLFDVAFSAAGLPPGATATFTPATVTKGSAATDVKLTISVPAATAQGSYLPTRYGAPLLVAFILFPLLGGRKMRNTLNSRVLAGLLLFLGIVASAAFSGCGGGGGSSGGSSQPPPPQSYTIMLTASGTGLTHSTNLNLTVQ